MPPPRDTPDRWALLAASLVGGLFAAVPLYGWRSFAGVVRDVGPGAGPTPGLQFGTAPGGPLHPGLLLALGVGLLVLAAVGPAVALHRDARFVAGVSDWGPRRRAWAAAAALFPVSILVAGAYLWRRHRRVGSHPEGRPTVEDLRASRLPVLVATLPVLAPVLAAAVTWWLYRPGDVLSAVPAGIAGAGVGGLGYAVLLLAFGLDFDWVRAGDLDWSPSRGRYLVPLLAALFVPLLLFVAAPVIAWVWVWNRRRRLRG